VNSGGVDGAIEGMCEAAHRACGDPQGQQCQRRRLWNGVAHGHFERCYACRNPTCCDAALSKPRSNNVISSEKSPGFTALALRLG
jgi:hypothetical protein